MFIHNYIKMNYINLGYLPGYPFYLISDNEMFDAFLKEDGFFDTFYPCPDESFREAYNVLREYIVMQISEFIASEGSVSLPDWIYSYMIMRPITFDSTEEDICYLSELAGISYQGVPEFNSELASKCYETSTKWIQKQPAKVRRRPPTMFGEAHVTKSLRLDQSNILIGTGGV